MKTDDISRVKDDLEVVREAAGLRLPFAREDVVVSLLGAAAVAVLLVVSLFRTDYWLIVGAVPALAITLAGPIWLAVKRRRRGQPSLEKHVHAFSTKSELIVAAAMLGFLAFSGRINIPMPYAYSTAFFFIGIMFLSFGIFHAPRRRHLAGAAALFVMAVGMPLSYDHNPVALVSASVAGWALADAGIMAIQLRKNRAAL